MIEGKKRYSLQKISILALCLAIMVSSCSRGKNETSDILVSSLKCNYSSNPLGIETAHPGLSWELYSARRGEHQQAYQILVSADTAKLRRNEGDVWNSGKVMTSRSVHVPYEGKPLKSATRYYWKVRVWDKEGRAGAWSDVAWWETALTGKSDWLAQWISAPRVFDWKTRSEFRQRLPKNAPPVHDDASPLFRKEFVAGKEIKSARLYISGLGYYEVFLNGEKVGDHLLDPAFTDYTKTVSYVPYDVTRKIKKGKNVLGVMLGNGWYNMFTRAVWSFDRAPWRNDPTLLCQLQLVYEDGSSQTVGSDTSWRCAPGPVTFNGIRQGETYDAGLEQEGWCRPGFDDGQWSRVRQVAGPSGTLHVQQMPPIKVVEEVAPVAVTKTGDGKYVVDFGKNLAGFVQLNVMGKRGQKITLKYGERLDAAGAVDQQIISMYVREKRFQTDEYIMKGTGKETWHPHFVYHGFRYVEVQGFPEKPDKENIKALWVHTALDTAGIFLTSNDLINGIQRMNLRSFLNNYHGYPTDCPHREKLGWMGDAQLTSETGLYNFQMGNAYTRFIHDILDSQKPEGAVPPVVPSGGWGYYWNIGPAYDNVTVILPWNLYLFTGDLNILRDTYPYLKKYFANYRRQARDNLIDLGLGDWCFAETQTPKIITATAYYYKEADLLSRIAGLLGEKEDQKEYAQLARQIREAYRSHFLAGDKYKTATQTTLGCALHFDMVDSAEKEKILRELDRRLPGKKLNMDFGVVGAKEVLYGLTAAGRPDIAWRVVNSTRYPGWGYWVSRGNSTIWETWDGKEWSLNHIMFGSVSGWLYKTLAGIKPDPEEPGFKHFYVEPFFPDSLEWVNAQHKSMYGTIRVYWKREQDSLILLLTVPANTSATLILPVKSVEDLTESGKALSDAEGVLSTKYEKNRAVIDLGSGNYRFRIASPLNF